MLHFKADPLCRLQWNDSQGIWSAWNWSKKKNQSLFSSLKDIFARLLQENHANIRYSWQTPRKDFPQNYSLGNRPRGYLSENYLFKLVVYPPYPHNIPLAFISHSSCTNPLYWVPRKPWIFLNLVKKKKKLGWNLDKKAEKIKYV